MFLGVNLVQVHRRGFHMQRAAFGHGIRAFTARFKITCVIWSGSSREFSRLSDKFVTNSMSSPMTRRNMCAVSVTTVFKLMTRACIICCRPNASICRVSAAARRPHSNLQHRFAKRALGRDLGRISSVESLMTTRILLKSWPSRRPVCPPPPAFLYLPHLLLQRGLPGHVFHVGRENLRLSVSPLR